MVPMAQSLKADDGVPTTITTAITKPTITYDNNYRFTIHHLPGRFTNTNQLLYNVPGQLTSTTSVD